MDLKIKTLLSKIFKINLYQQINNKNKIRNYYNPIQMNIKLRKTKISIIYKNFKIKFNIYNKKL